MRLSWRFAAAGIMLGGLAGMMPVPDTQSDVARVETIIARSKLTQTTYAVYFWSRIQRPGEKAVEEWSAEFHSGSLHRVETPRDRLIADCAARTGVYLSLTTGKLITGPQVAGVACGISTNQKFLALESLGRIKTHFADADRVRVTDSELVRTYDISDDGIILRTIFETNEAKRQVVLENEAVEIARSLPESNMFDEASLSTSFVPEKFKVAPGAIR